MLPMVNRYRVMSGSAKCHTEKKFKLGHYTNLRLHRDLGRRGGLIGGHARAANMTAEERSESARKAVQARWARVKKKKVKKTVS